jgi:hypothetical protein
MFHFPRQDCAFCVKWCFQKIMVQISAARHPARWLWTGGSSVSGIHSCNQSARVVVQQLRENCWRSGFRQVEDAIGSICAYPHLWVHTLPADFRFICMHKRTLSDNLHYALLPFSIVLAKRLYKSRETSCMHCFATRFCCGCNNTPIRPP